MPVPDFSPGEVLTAAAMDSIGMWLINTTSFSGATQVDFTNVFSADYDSYRIVFHFWEATVAENHFFRLRSSGGVISTTDYLTVRSETNSASTYTTGYIGGGYSTTWFPTYIGSSTTPGVQVNGTMDIFRPFTANRTKAISSFNRNDTDIFIVNATMFYRLDTAITGFSLIRNSTATMTGKVSVYGYRN